MRIHTFPEHYGEDCVLVELDRAFLPLIVGQVELMLQRRYWASDEDYYQGHSAAAEAIAAMANNCMQAIVDGQDRLYRLLDTALNGRVYTESAGVIEPAIPIVPPDPAFENYSHLANMDGLFYQMRTYLASIEETTRLMTVADNGSNLYAYNGITLYDLLQALNALPAGIPVPGDYASVLSTIAFNTGITHSNTGVTENVISRLVCCDLATVEPLAATDARPADDYMCRGLQLIGFALRATLLDLWRYKLENLYVDATGIALIINRDFQAWTLGGVSQQTATELVGKVRDLPSGAGSYEQLNDAELLHMAQAVFSATDALQARNLYQAWADTIPFVGFEIQQAMRVLGRDQAIWNNLFSGNLTATDYAGDVCASEPPPPPEEFTLYSDYGLIVDTDTMTTLPFSSHQYLEIGGSYTSYLGTADIDSNHHMYKTATYSGGLNNPPIFAFFNTNWGGVQLKIASGPEDVSLIFQNESASIGLSSSTFTTLPSGTTNFWCYSPSSELTPFTLTVIFP